MGHFWPILGHLGPFRVTFWPSWVILGLDVALGHSRRVFFFFFFVTNVAFTRVFCRESRDNVLFGVEYCQKFWQKFLEILRILAEILRKKLATGASDLNSTKHDQPTILNRCTSTGVDIFFSLIFSYFCFLVAAFSPCHGREPL